MNFFDFYAMFLSVILVFLLGWLLPLSGKSFDVLKLRLDLFPNWFKFIALGWVLLTLALTIIVFYLDEKWEYFLVVNLNFSFFLLLFSKEKEEDEFSEQIRLKAFLYAFITYLTIIILFGAVYGSPSMSEISFVNSNIVLQIFLGVALLSALVYFYVSKYKFSKENK